MISCVAKVNGDQGRLGDVVEFRLASRQDTYSASTLRILVLSKFVNVDGMLFLSLNIA